MGIFQGLADLPPDSERGSGIATATRLRANQAVEIGAIDELQDEIMALALLTNVIYGDNMGMGKAGGGFGFLSKRAKESWSRPSPLMTLTATVRPSLVSSALKTTALPPSPSFLTTLYLPRPKDSNTIHLPLSVRVRVLL